MKHSMLNKFYYSYRKDILILDIFFPTKQIMIVHLKKIKHKSCNCYSPHKDYFYFTKQIMIIHKRMKGHAVFIKQGSIN